MVPDLEGLRAAYQQDVSLRNFLDHFGINIPRRVTRLLHLQNSYHGHPRFSRTELLRLLHLLETLGCGSLLEPNQKIRTRFAWRLRVEALLHLVTHPDLALAAGDFVTGHPPELPSILSLPDGLARLAVEILPGRTARLEVPADLRAEEAEWLGAYLLRYARQNRPAAPGA